jgi:hypothetical protein
MKLPVNGHNGSAGDRSNAFSCAMNKAGSLHITLEQSWITTFYCLNHLSLICTDVILNNCSE